MSEDFAGVDFEYEYKSLTDLDNDITRALHNYLNLNGVKTYKVISPVVNYEGETYNMKTRALVNSKGSFEDTFKEILEEVKDARVVLLYTAYIRFGYSADVDENFEPYGEPIFREARYVRYATI
jgi:hypothetical protein